MNLHSNAAATATHARLREYGLQQNVPVFFFPGPLGTALMLDEARTEWLARRHELRLFVVESMSDALPLMSQVPSFGVLGFSFGAADALRTAAASPSVSSVGLVSPAPDLSLPRLRAAGLPALAPLLSAAGELRERAARGSSWNDLPNSTSPAMRRLWSSLPASDRRVLRRIGSSSAWRQLLNETEQASLIERIESIVQPWDLDMGEVTAPVDVLYGGADPWCSDEVAHWLRRALPRCGVRRVEAAGHFSAMVDHSDALLDGMRELLYQPA